MKSDLEVEKIRKYLTYTSGTNSFPYVKNRSIFARDKIEHNYRHKYKNTCELSVTT